MRTLVACCTLVLVVIAFRAGSRYQDSRASASPIHDLSMKRIEGATQKLSDYKGKVALIVNVASECGMTPQYEGLQKLHAKYSSLGFTVLGFPSNDFNQEPGPDDQILAFAHDTYGVVFPLFSKVSVKGPDACPLYRYLQLESPAKALVEWNFQKFLIDGSGNVIASFSPKTPPDDPKLVAAIEAALGMKPRPVESQPASGPRLELIHVAYDGLKLSDGSTFSERAEREKRTAAREDGRRYEPPPGIEWRPHKIDPDAGPPETERGEFLFRGGGVFTEADLGGAKPDRDKIGQRTVIVSVKPERQAAFEAFTTACLNHPLAIVFDGLIITSPVVEQPLKDSIQIRNPAGFTKKDQQTLLDAFKTVK
jgi:glutathione peroxidase